MAHNYGNYPVHFLSAIVLASNIHCSMVGVSEAHLAGRWPQLGDPRQLTSPESRSSASAPTRTGSRAAAARRVSRRSTEAPVGRTAADPRRSPPEPSLQTSQPKT